MTQIKAIPSLALFALSLAVPAAHADSIDDFVLTGTGETITFSLPASPQGNESTCPTSGPISCLPGSQTAFYLTTLVTTNGITANESLSFPTYRFGGGLEIVSDRYFGNQLFVPDAATPTFLTGTFALNGAPFDDYTLTITPEAPTTSATPEPSSLLLLATGALGLTGTLTRRLRRS